MKIVSNDFKIKNFLFFLILFYINIGSKEIFRFLEENGFVVFGVIVLTVIGIVSFLKVPKNYIKLFIISSLFYYFIVFMALFSNDLEYGLEKAYLGLLLPLTLFSLFNKKKWNEGEIVNYLILSVFIISIIGILFKLRGGFFERSVRFGLLGSIPFGWVNGMAFLALVLQKQKKIKMISLAIFFFLMVIWTGSKGPLIGIVFLTLLFFNRVIGKKMSSKILVLSVVIALVVFLSNYSDDIRSMRSITSFIDNPEEYSEGAGKGSIGTRSEYYNLSLKMVYENPLLGVGFGGWQENSGAEHKYPHNIFFELLAEIGTLGVCFFFIMLFQLKYNNTIAYLGVFGLVTLMFSGDFSYFRYALYPLLMGFYVYVQNKQNLKIN